MALEKANFIIVAKTCSACIVLFAAAVGGVYAFDRILDGGKTSAEGGFKDLSGGSVSNGLSDSGEMSGKVWIRNENGDVVMAAGVSRTANGNLKIDPFPASPDKEEGMVRDSGRSSSQFVRPMGQLTVKEPGQPARTLQVEFQGTSR